MALLNICSRTNRLFEPPDHQNMLGISTGTAQNDVVKARAKKISGRRDMAPSSLGVERVDQ